MEKELDTLRKQIEETLKQREFIVFHGTTRFGEPLPMIRWDAESYADPGAFLAVAQQLEVRLIVYNRRVFDETMMERAEQQLEAADLAREEHREFERSLSKLHGYVGFTCALQLTFDHDGNTYLYEVMTPWFREFLDILDEIEDMGEMAGEEEDDSPLGGYYSQN